MVIELVTPQNIFIQLFSSLDSSQTNSLRRTTLTIKRLCHSPLGARMKERQLVALAQCTVFDNAHLEVDHVEFQRQVAGVVDEGEVRVQLDANVTAGLDRRVSAVGSVCGTRNPREEGAGRQGYHRGCG